MTDKKLPFILKETVQYNEDSIVSKKIVENKAGGFTAFAFDKDQRLSEHTAPFDAVVTILDGKAEITINKEVHLLTEGMTIVMPANIPHGLYAVEKFKMALVMIKDKN